MDFGTLTGLYRQYLGRDPEPGAEAWLQYDDGTIVNGIANSEEANNFRNQQQQQQQPAPPQPEQPPPAAGTDRNTIAQLYRQYLGRDPEPGAYDYWGSRNYNDIVQGITNSAEYAQRLSGQQPAPAQTAEQAGLPNYPAPTAQDLQTQQVVDLYQRFLGRNPDPAALAADVQLLRKDPASYGWLVNSVANSPEAQKAAEVGRTNVGDVQDAINSQIGKYGYTYPRTTSGGLYNVINTIIGVGTAAIASFAAPEIGAAILAELGADAATIASYANAVGNAATAAGSTTMQQALNERKLEDVIKAAATAGGTAGVSAGAGQAVGSVLPSGLPSTVAGGVTGAGAGALTSLVAGKDPLTGAIKGAIPGAVGGGIRDLSGSFGSYDPTDIGEPVYDPVTGRELSPEEVAAMYPDAYPGGVLPKAGQQTVYNPDGTVRYVSPGADIAARTGSVLAGGLVNYLMPTTTPSKVPGTKTSTTTTSRAPTAGTTTTGTPTKSTGASYILGSPTALSTTGPGSQALSQVLNLGSPTSAYTDVGAEGESLSKETGGKPRNVWNIESLRVKDETGS